MKFDSIITNKVYEEHNNYLDNLPDNLIDNLRYTNNPKHGKRMVIRDTKFFRLDMSDANLSDADFTDSVMINSTLISTHLSYTTLTRTDLSWSKFNGSFIGCVDFAGAKLYGSDFMNCTIYHTDFIGADLRYSDFTDSDITWSDFTGAKLNNCKGDGKIIRNFDNSLRYRITNYKDIMAIGCQQHTIEQWFNFTDNQIEKMDKNALEWWNTHKDKIKNWLS
jgi:hypothetical protein